ncbi:MAG: branched-chain amino acid ABC transporter permease, partial [Candidatus Bathyarchaeia archaeon]
MSGVVIGGFYSLMSIGLSLIFGVTKMVNFAHGEFMMLGMYLTYWIWHFTGADPYLLLLISMPTLFLFGALIYKVLINRVIGGIDEQQIFLTVGLSIFLQNIALLSWTGTYRTVTTAYSMAILSAGPVTISVPRFLAFVCSVILAVAITLFLKFTKTG